MAWRGAYRGAIPCQGAGRAQLPLPIIPWLPLPITRRRRAASRHPARGLRPAGGNRADNGYNL